RTVAEEVKLAAQAIRVWRGNQPPVTAVGAFNDELALALLAGLRSLQLEAPRDLALVGIDDIPQAKFAAPPLTTVKVSNAVIARYLGMTIVRQLKGEPPPRSPKSVTRLVVRDSA